MINKVCYWIVYAWISLKIAIFQAFIWIDKKWKAYEDLRLRMFVESQLFYENKNSDKKDENKS